MREFIGNIKDFSSSINDRLWPSLWERFKGAFLTSRPSVRILHSVKKNLLNHVFLGNVQMLLCTSACNYQAKKKNHSFFTEIFRRKGQTRIFMRYYVEFGIMYIKM